MLCNHIFTFEIFVHIFPLYFIRLIRCSYQKRNQTITYKAKYFLVQYNWCFFNISTGFRFSKISVEYSIHICSCPYLKQQMSVNLWEWVISILLCFKYYLGNYLQSSPALMWEPLEMEPTKLVWDQLFFRWL